jgi:hypothetical protein
MFVKFSTGSPDAPPEPSLNAPVKVNAVSSDEYVVPTKKIIAKA